MDTIAERNSFLDNHFRIHSEKLTRMIGFKVGVDNASDVVQEAYCRALQYWDSFDSNIKPFDTWFKKVFNSAVVKILHGNQDLSEGVDENAVLFSVPASGEDAVQVYEVSRNLRKLPERKQQVVILSIIYGYDSSSVAIITGFSQNHVRQIVHKFRRKIL